MRTPEPSVCRSRSNLRRTRTHDLHETHAPEPRDDAVDYAVSSLKKETKKDLANLREEIMEDLDKQTEKILEKLLELQKSK